LKVPALLRKTLHSTNPIESVFSRVRSCEKNIKRYSRRQFFTLAGRLHLLRIRLNHRVIYAEGLYP
jgi:hypothetical protein